MLTTNNLLSETETVPQRQMIEKVSKLALKTPDVQKFSDRKFFIIKLPMNFCSTHLDLRLKIIQQLDLKDIHNIFFD